MHISSVTHPFLTDMTWVFHSGEGVRLVAAMASLLAQHPYPDLCACVQVDLPVDKGVVMLDIGFTGTDPNHGETTLLGQPCTTEQDRVAASKHM